MRFVVGWAFRKALARSILAFGLFSLAFPVIAARALDGLANLKGTPPFWQRLSHAFYIPPPSPWDYPLAIGIAAVSVVAAVLIWPKRPSPDRFANLS